MIKSLKHLAILIAFMWYVQKFFSWLFERANTSASYVFNPHELQEIANCGTGLPIKKRWETIHQELLRRYPGKMAPEVRWVFNSSGNVICQLAMVYGSPTEYVAFFGTPIGATGFSGRYGYAHVWDLMVEGKMLTYTAGQFEPTEYQAGDSAYLERGASKGVAYVGSTWMIDYGRGLPVTMMPFGIIAPAIFNTLDYESAWKQMADYGKLVLRGMAQK